MRIWTYLRTSIKLLSAKLPAASSEYFGSGSRGARNSLDKQRKIRHKKLKNNEKHRQILRQEPTRFTVGEARERQIGEIRTRRVRPERERSLFAELSAHYRNGVHRS
jgi:hypothetical protein